jgi:DNA-binding NtrC family response regulator
MSVECVKDDRPQVVVVDDDMAICTLVQEVLKDEGYNVLSVDNRLRLPELANIRRALVLYDLSLDDGVIAATIAKRGSVNVIIMSGHSDIQRKAREIGARDILRKPFDLEALSEVVRRWLPESAA